LESEHVANIPQDDYARLQYGDRWVHRKGQEHVFDVSAITQASFMGREGEQIISTWDRDKVMKRIQMLGAHEQVSLSDVPTIRSYIKTGPGSPLADEFAFILGGEPDSIKFCWVVTMACT
jgi:hypothetical protein